MEILSNVTTARVLSVVQAALAHDELLRHHHRHHHLPDSVFDVNDDNEESGNFGDVCVDQDLLEIAVRAMVRNVTAVSREKRREMEGDPLLYIVAVLFFYSCGIALLMINYMKKEQHDSEEANLYKEYVEKARSRCDEMSSRGRTLNKLALQALNAVNAISQDDQTRVAFV